MRRMIRAGAAVIEVQQPRVDDASFSETALRARCQKEALMAYLDLLVAFGALLFMSKPILTACSTSGLNDSFPVTAERVAGRCR